MTISRRYFIECDHKDCTEISWSCSAEYHDETCRFARAANWSCTKRGDYCPKHNTRRQKKLPKDKPSDISIHAIALKQTARLSMLSAEHEEAKAEIARLRTALKDTTTDDPRHRSPRLPRS
jgi:hypothetical protein